MRVETAGQILKERIRTARVPWGPLGLDLFWMRQAVAIKLDKDGPAATKVKI